MYEVSWETGLGLGWRWEEVPFKKKKKSTEAKSWDMMREHPTQGISQESTGLLF